MLKHRDWFSWNPTEVDRSTYWIRMNNAERGLFIILLNHSWLHGGLPSDPREIYTLIKMQDAYCAFLSQWQRVKLQFTPTTDGRLVNPKLEEDRRRAIARSARCSSVAAHVSHTKSPGFVYLVRRPDDGAIKIGSSVNPDRRLAQINQIYPGTAPVSRFRVMSRGDVEVELHQRYTSQRLDGEWFLLSGEDIAEIIAHLESIAIQEQH